MIQFSFTNIDWNVVGTMASAIAATVVALGTFIAWLGRRFERRLVDAIDPVRQENERLKNELDTRLRIPSFSLDAIKLTELSAQKRIEQLRAEHDLAISTKDSELQRAIAAQLSEINELRRQLESSAEDGERLENALNSLLLERMPSFGGNAVLLPNNVLLIIRHKGKYGALLAIEQSGQNRGSFIRYAWWYQPDGSANFLSPTTQFGFGEAGEGRPTQPEILIGPIQIEWSVCAEGKGWMYFGTFTIGFSTGIEFAIAQPPVIRDLDPTQLRFVGPSKPNPANAYPFS